MLTRPRPRFGPAASPAAVGVAMLVSLAALTGCTAQTPAAPTPPAATPTYHPATPTPASDADVEAAVAALSKYVDTANNLVWTDPASFDALYAQSVGDQNAYDRDFYGGMLSHGWHLEGASTVTVLGGRRGASESQVVLSICVDATNTHVFDEAGAERKPTGVRPVQAMTATLTRDDAHRWLVADLSSREGAPEC